ncbi:site-specific DNA-methyltransferase [Campylobacter sp. CLAX-7218-21]|uniref:site-specific DNA-methyltransferase n=1 Tax=Campylobacter devanensis TaxID=3161138 RepID=UPI002EAF6068|nr:site-specific DNA-methyltransferase [Campylobacter sp. CLAX-7218-21]
MIDKNLIKEAKIKEPVKNEFYELLKSKFPQTINSDGAVNFDAIKMLLDIKVKENIKGYELNWIGKGLANALYNTPCDKELKFNETKSKNTERTQNIIIKGDNLDALKLLKSAYYEKIKMIYIDPPYNTKNDDFIYPDDFRKDYKQICIETGLIKIEIDEFGNETEVLSEAMNFFNSITSTKSHSGWLSFMLPRLKLARDLLKDDGVIFISIDDNEQANLKLLCDEIFGEENFIGNLILKSAPAGTQSSNFIAQQQSYCLVYSKNNNEKSIGKIILTDKQIDEKYPEIDKIGKYNIERLWKRGIGGKKEDVPSLHFPVYYDEKTQKIYIDDEVPNNFENLVEIIPYQTADVLGRWTWSKDKMKDEKFRLVVKKVAGEWKLHKKNYAKDDLGKLPNSIIDSDIARTEIGSLELKELMKEKVFDYPKSIKLLQYFIQLATNPNNHDIILDFFAGSGTTAHAVMAQNAQDNGNRKFILVQLDEKIDEKKSKTAFDFCKNELGSKEPVISDITIERVKRAGNKLEKPNLDTGFCVYDLTDKDTLIQKSDGSLELYLNADLTPLDKALNLALQSGKMIDIKSEEIYKDKLYKFDDSYYIISYDKNVLESLEATTDKPVYISGYNDIKIDDFLNLQSVLKDRLNVVY